MPSLQEQQQQTQQQGQSWPKQQHFVHLQAWGPTGQQPLVSLKRGQDATQEQAQQQRLKRFLSMPFALRALMPCRPQALVSRLQPLRCFALKQTAALVEQQFLMG